MGFLGSRDTPIVILDAATSGSVWRARVTGGSGAPVLLMSASDDRTHGSIFNHTNGSLFIGYDHAGLSTMSFDAKMASGSYFELPRPIWQGRVWGIWDIASGGVAMVLDISGSTT